MGQFFSCFDKKEGEEEKKEIKLEVVNEGRSCTDILCLVFYVIGLITFIAIGAAGISLGGE